MKVFIDTKVAGGALTSVSRGGVREQVKLLCAAYYDIIYMSRFCYD